MKYKIDLLGTTNPSLNPSKSGDISAFPSLMSPSLTLIK